MIISELERKAPSDSTESPSGSTEPPPDSAEPPSDSAELPSDFSEPPSDSAADGAAGREKKARDDHLGAGAQDGPGEGAPPEADGGQNH